MRNDFFKLCLYYVVTNLYCVVLIWIKCKFCSVASFERVVSDSKSSKGRVHCFSMQVVMNKCFLLNSEKKKKFAQIRLFVFEKNTKNARLIPKNGITETKARLL